MRNLFLTLIDLYRLCVSPLLPGACRFHPSCSHYARDAFRLHPWPRAGLLTARRLLSCRPGGGRGFDPVPEALESRDA